MSINVLTPSWEDKILPEAEKQRLVPLLTRNRMVKVSLAQVGVSRG